MRSVYGKECAKHPELAGRRYLPSNNCIECQRELNREGNKRRKAAQQVRDERLALLEVLLKDAREIWGDYIPNHSSNAWKVMKRIDEALKNDHE